ncbi:MAG: ankyrin repeat domain-containing protein [Treponema sp.]|jgi:ankyrin repeat protein|nr:ankyrin repeat domain-containing protein [Treponema sp.]
MEKPALFFPAMSAVCALFLAVILGCASAPPPEAPPPAIPEEDVWSLLAKGDGNVKDFFSGKMNVRDKDAQGRTPLHYAAQRGDTQLAAFFISLGADANALDNAGLSPLGICVERADAQTAALLVKSGADIHLPLGNGGSAARMALGKDSPVLRSILTPESVKAQDSDGRTILHLAADAGNSSAAQDILGVMTQAGVPADKADKGGKNALDLALAKPSSRPHMEIAEKLILAGVNSKDPLFSFFALAARSGNYNIRRPDGIAPLHYAAQNGYEGFASFLLGKNADVNIKSASGATPLHEAVRAGNIPIITMLLDKGANANLQDAKGNTPLHLGVPAEAHREVARLLLEKKADVNLRDEHGDTPLHVAVILNRPAETVKTFLDAGSSVHIRNIDGKTPLYLAVQEKRSSLIPLLLPLGSDVFAADNAGVTPFDLALADNGNLFSVILTPETVNQNDSAGNTMLHVAVLRRQSPERIGMILDRRPMVNVRNKAGDTALHTAARMNQKDNGEFLISRGADIFAVNQAGESPLYIALAAAGGFRQWIVNPTTVNARDGLENNMLHYAAHWKLNGTIPFITRNGVPVESVNATGETPLFMAVKADSPSTIKTLLDVRANLHARDSQGNSALHAAVRWNALNSASLLIDSGIDINAHSLNGNTPLHDAVSLGIMDIENLLVEKGADIEVRDIDGNTPFLEAVNSGSAPAVRRLAAYGANPFTRNAQGDTPLHAAVAQERYDLVNLLLRLGASIHARNAANITPFETALALSPRMVAGLLAGDRINLADDLGNSALHIAIQERASAATLKAIIDQGCRLNASDYNGKTPLRLALDLGLLEQAKILADAGAGPFQQAADGKTPADIALAKGKEYLWAVFSGKAINAKDSSGNTILHLAARGGTPETIILLLELGANKTIRNISSESPADVAVKWNRGDNAALL